MAIGERDLQITLRALIGDFITPMRTAAAEVRTFGKEVAETFDRVEERGENLKHVWKDLFEALIGIEILDVLKRVAEAANNAADALEIAANTTKNFGHGSADYVAEMDAWLRRLAASAQGGGFALTEMRDSLQQLATTGATESQQQRLLVDVLGLAAAKHLTVAEATRLAVLAANGHVEMLSRYGIQVKDATGKTVDFATAMQRWESEVAGAAEKRAEGLEGAFGRVKNALDRLANSAFGKQLITDFEGAANAATRFLDALAKLPPGVLQFAAALTFALLSLTAVGLLLPAVKIAFEFLRDGVGLATGALSLIGKTGGFVINALRDLITWLGLARTAWAEMAIAEWLAEAPLIGIVAAVVAVIAIVVELILHLNELGKAFETVTTYGKKVWKEFADGFADNAKSIAYGIRAIYDQMRGRPDLAMDDIKRGQALSRDFTPDVFQPFKSAITGVGDFAKSMWRNVVGFFKAELANVKLPPIDWSGLGGPQKLQAADLAALFAPIDAALAAAKHRVEEAQNALEETAAKLAVLRDKRDPFKPLTAGNVAEEQRLEREEMERTLTLRRAIAQQRDAEVRAAQLEQQLQSRVTGTAQEQSKAHAEIAKRVNEHISAASKLNGEWIKMGGTIAKLGREITLAFDPLKDQVRALRDLANEAQSADARQAIGIRAETDRFHYEKRGVSIPQSGYDAAAEAKRQADFSAAEARQTRDEATEKQNTFVERYGGINAIATASVAIRQEFERLRIAEQNASLALTKAADAAKLADEKLRALASRDLTGSVQELLSKIGQQVGLYIKHDPQTGNFSGVGLSLPTLFLNAAEKSKAFADIMSVVNQIMKVFSEIIDALRPIIDLLLRAIAFVVNIFIDLYNMIGRLLRLFGIHVALLDRINTDFGNLDKQTVPLISITHALPTLNELAAGKLNSPLSLQPQGYNSLGQITQKLDSPSLGGGLLQGLLELGVLLLLVNATHLLHIGVHQSLTAIVVSTLQAGFTAVVTGIQTLGTAIAGMGGGGGGGFLGLFGKALPFVGGALLLASLFSHHGGSKPATSNQSASADQGVTFTPGFVQLLHSATDVRNGFNDLMTALKPAADVARSVTTSLSAFGSSIAATQAQVASGAAAAIGSGGSAAANGPVSIQITPQINNPKISGYRDVDALSRDLADASARKLSRAFGLNRVPLGV